ncbi:MAG TPA: prolipoprotein diacylglyceryl transferase [Anaerolineae bacterium]
MFCDFNGRPSICIGSTPIFTFYSLIILLGALMGGYIAASEARRRGENPEIVWDGLIVVIIAGIIGARLYHAFSTPAGCTANIPGCGWPWYQNHPLDIILLIRDGGLGIFGAVLGGGLAMLFYARRRKLSFWKYLDFAAPALLVGQAIGRWGNFVNQELYGPPTDLPWGLSIDAAHRTYQYVDLASYPVETTRFHPLFLYESMLNLLGFVLLIVISRRFANRLKEGDLILLYFLWYPVVRIFVESFRFDAWTSIANIPTASLISIVAALLALAILIVRHRRHVPQTA